MARWSSAAAASVGEASPSSMAETMSRHDEQSMTGVVAGHAPKVPTDEDGWHVDELTRLAIEAGRGDRVALAAFVRRTQPEVWRLCRHLTGPAGADDTTQDTYLRAIPALAGFRAEASARTWLLGIARRAAADAIRREQRQRRLTPRRQAPTPDPAGQVAVERLLDPLDRDRREAFVLTQLLGLSYAEAAAVCDVAIGTIRSRVARARAELAEAARRADEA